MSIEKTNAARLLDKAKIHYELISYEVDESDLKKASKISGNKSCDLIPMKELLSITGYIRGACSPIGMKKHFPTYIHESCLTLAKIYISAGKRGLQLLVAPQDLITEVKGTVGFLILTA